MACAPINEKLLKFHSDFLLFKAGKVIIFLFQADEH